MAKFQGIPKEDLKTGQKSPGLVRDVAFNEAGVAVLRSRSQPGTKSGWHHHGDHDVYGYVVSGRIRLESGPEGREAISLGPGGFLCVPANTVHREINPSEDEPAEVVLFLKGEGDTVFNVESPAKA